NFNYDYKFDEMKWKLDELNSGRVKAALEKASEMRFEIEPKIQIALENSKLDRDFQLDLQRASREAERAMQESSREIQRAQMEMQRGLQRANMKFSVGGDRFESASPRQAWAKE